MRAFLAVIASAVVLSGCMQIIGGVAAVGARDKYRNEFEILGAGPPTSIFKEIVFDELVRTEFRQT